MESKNKGLLAYILVCILWGSTYIAIRIGVRSFPPFLFGGIRFLVAGSLILLYGHIKKLKFPNDKKDYIKISIAGLLMLGLSNSLILIAEMRINSSTAALLVAITPIFMAIIELFIPGGSRISLFGWMGMLIGFAGVGVLSLGGEGFDTDIAGIMLVILAALAWACGSIHSKRTVVGGSIIIHIGVQMLAGGMAQTIMGIITGELSRLHPEFTGILALIYLVIFGSLIGYTSYIYLISVWPISKAGTYAYINPIVAMILGWLILKEPVTLRMIVSTVLVLAGVVIVQKSKVVQKKAEEVICQ
ncbi:EamA family transporter [Lutispora thermophila]|uniref:Permease of the drug/metabolite transporter (DMT) superfamily n=1 Tax=Lutispora thermophila DSM 19022 TaxID=1122184 RepID=A0A1M6B4V6_9FIRM|nr:EamA family transporter [Lutispora thermophila]SHI43771.1 Permease of the drug/metabolite transporter (DMT) superfamily [Lutispora thermophila DSM 19022]